MFNTEIGIFCNVHKNWKELLSDEPYCLKIKEDGDYVIFNYNQVASDFSNPIVKEARGIIFKKGEWRNPVCWAFDKFFNYGEPNADKIDWNSATVTEKVDGSLIKLWHDDEKWHISTNGTIDALKAEVHDVNMPNFLTYFLTVLENYYKSFIDFLNGLDKSFTYMFELVGPYNRIVIPYEKAAIYFLGARNKYSGSILGCSAFKMNILGVDKLDCPKTYPLTSLEDCINLTEHFTWEQEGFVVADYFGNRIKVKSPEYVKAHFVRTSSTITRRHLVRIILANEVDEFLCYAADYKEQLYLCKSLMDTYYKLGDMFAAIGRKASVMDRKNYAMMVKECPKLFHDLMFINYNRDCYAKEYTLEWSDRKWEDCLDSLEVLINDL